MADGEYVPGAGDVEITLAGEKLYLKPTLAACLALSEGGEDGPRSFSNKALMLNIHAITRIIAVGTGKKEADILPKVFETGTVNLFGACITFVHIVSNGGRRPRAEEEKTDGDPPKSS